MTANNPHRSLLSGRAHARPAANLEPHLRLISLLVAGALALSVAGAEAASRIYRTVDENGNVVFTDVPPRPEQPGEAVELETGNSFTPPPRTTPAAGESGVPLEDWLDGGDGAAEGEPQGVEEAEQTTVNYQSLQITSPAHDAAVRENAGNVTIAAAIQPSLATGHVMQVFLDGQLRQQGHATTFQLVNLDRGTHNVQVRVVDQTGSQLISSEPSVFHLQRRSVILQPGNRAN
jgi:hypothetical protein